MNYLQLFWSFIQVGLLSIGGGYAAISLIQEQVTEAHHWLTLTQFTDLVTIAEMTPGAIAINAATFVGMKIGGLPGALIATAGCLFPAFIIVPSLAFVYYKYRDLSLIRGILDGVSPAVVAMIASAGITILILALWRGEGFNTAISSINFVAVFLFAGAFFLLRKLKKSPIFTMILCGVVGMIIYRI